MPFVTSRHSDSVVAPIFHPYPRADSSPNERRTSCARPNISRDNLVSATCPSTMEDLFSHMTGREADSSSFVAEDSPTSDRPSDVVTGHSGAMETSSSPRGQLAHKTRVVNLEPDYAHETADAKHAVGNEETTRCSSRGQERHKAQCNEFMSAPAKKIQVLYRRTRTFSLDGSTDDSEHLHERYLSNDSGINNLQAERSSRHSIRFATFDSRVNLVPGCCASADSSNDHMDHSTFSNPFDNEPVNSRKSSSSSDLETYLRAGAFPRHRDTLARLHRASSDTEDSSAESTSSAATMVRRRIVETAGNPTSTARPRRSILPFPSEVIKRVLSFLSFEDYKSARLTCRNWLLCLPEPRLPVSYRLPGEVLQLIYRHLSPLDFEVARHVCKNWFLASLDKNLLLRMIKTAGASSAAGEDLKLRQTLLESRSLSWSRHLVTDHESRDVRNYHQPELDDIVTEEWLYSKRLATEARLIPGGLHYHSKAENRSG